jgi:hypothetical protein
MQAPSVAPVMTWHDPVPASPALHVWHTAQSAEVAQLFLRHSPGALELLQVDPEGQAEVESQ